MSRKSVETMTAYGKTAIALTVCDACGQEGAQQDHYTPLTGWNRLIQPVPDKQYPTRKELDFCSVDCLVGTLIPDIYSSDPAAVLRAVNNLKRIEKDLDGTPKAG